MRKLGLMLLGFVIACVAVVTIYALIGVSLNLFRGDRGEYREAAKHEPFPRLTPIEISVDSIVQWPTPPTPGSTSPRTDRELQLFRISKAYLQNVWFNAGDGDIHFEISQTQDKSAPRVIAETPAGNSYEGARSRIIDALLKRGISIPKTARVPGNQTDIVAIEVEVQGLAFYDKPHYRGSKGNTGTDGTFPNFPHDFHPQHHHHVLCR